MNSKILADLFSINHNVQIIKNPEIAISKALTHLNKNDGLAILGTHCLGPAVSDKFNISFDTL